jgi:phosphoenolpyruvate synthase/pyruvate phosphate dikinase
MSANVLWFSELGLDDLDQVGGKNSSLGEMVQNLSKAGVRVPNGFATTADAYRRFIAHEDLAEAISVQLADLDIDDVARLAVVGRNIRSAVVAQPFPPDLEAEIRAGYAELAGGDEQLSFAVRSSATAEDLTFVAPTPSCRPSKRCSRLSITTGPSPTASTMISTTTRSPSPRAFSRWCAPTSAHPG